MKKVSVIVPAYNAEKYIDKCLKSILDQTYQELEIIVVNDGSTDMTEQIIEIYCQRYPGQVHCYTKENGGLSSARNYGIMKAVSKYVIFLDSDDYLATDYVEILVNAAEENGSDVVCSGQFRVSDDGVVLSKVFYQLDKNNHCVLRHLNMHGKLYRLGYIKGMPIRFPDGKLYEDNSFNLVMFFLTKNIIFLDYEGYYQLVHRDSITTRKIEKNSIPFDELEESLKYLQQNKDKINDFLVLEYTFLSFLAYFIFEANKKHRFYKLKDRKSDMKLIYYLCDYTRYIVDSYFPEYNKNRYLKLKNKKDVGIKQFVSVLIFTILIRFNLLKIFAFIYYKI